MKRKKKETSEIHSSIFKTLSLIFDFFPTPPISRIPHAASYPLLFVFLLFFCACERVLYVKEDLTQGQIIETTVIRKPTGQIGKGPLPIYNDYFEGYLRGGIMDRDGNPLQGITIKVQNQNGEDIPNFVSGITDENGIYKIRFSLPITWNRVDVSGTLSLAREWIAKNPDNEFRIFFDRKIGVLSYVSKMNWITAAGEDETEKKPVSKKEKGTSLKPPEKKKEDDIFGNFDFSR